MCGGSVRRTLKITCTTFNVLGFIAALGLLATTHSRFHAYAKEKIRGLSGLDKVLNDDMLIVAPLVAIVYVFSFIAFVGMQEYIKIIVLIYGIVMYILGLILFLYTFYVYGPAHIALMEDVERKMGQHWNHYIGDTGRGWQFAWPVMYQHTCCGRYSYMDYRIDSTEKYKRVPIPCCKNGPQMFLDECVHRMITRIGCEDKFRTDYYIELALVRSVYLIVSFIWLATGVLAFYYGLFLFCHPKQPHLVIERIRVQ